MTARAVPTGTALDDDPVERGEAHRAAVQRRTMGTLVAMQASGNAAIASVVAVSSLLAADLLGGEALAGLGSAMFTAGRGAGRRAPGAAHAPPGSSPRAGRGLRDRRRRCGAGDDRGPGRVVPALRRGPVPDRAGQAANLVGRYVAVDLALPDRRARAISIVVWTGTLGAVLGPTFATLEKDAAGSAGFNRLIGPLVFSGAYFVLAAMVVAVFMRPDPLVVAGGLAAPSEPRVRRTAQVRGAFPGDPALPRRPPRPGRGRHLADGDGRGHDDDPAPHARPRPGRPVGVRHRRPHRRHVRPGPGGRHRRRSPRAGPGHPGRRRGARSGHDGVSPRRLPPGPHLQRAVPARPGLELRADRRQHPAHGVRARPRPRRRAGCCRPGHGAAARSAR